MAEVRLGPALIDSSMTSLFMDQRYAKHYRLTTRKLHSPISVYNIYGLPNEAGSITEVVDAILHLNRHTKQINFALTNLGKQNLVLRFTWLEEHNPEVNWQTKVTMSWCPDECHTCQTEIQEEWKTLQKEEQWLWACRMGPLPRFTEDEVESESL